MMNKKLRETVRQVVGLLVQGKYDELEKLSGGVRLSASEMAQAISEYDGTFVMPPDSAFDDLDIVETEGPPPPQWYVCINLWTLGEGQSDLSLELTLIEFDQDSYIIEIDNLHVL
jgi:hypothetical protein